MAKEIKDGGTLSKGTTYTWFITKKEKTLQGSSGWYTMGVQVALEMTITDINTSNRTVKVSFQRVLYAQYQDVDAIPWLTKTPTTATAKEAGYRYILKLKSSDNNSHGNLPSENSGKDLAFKHNVNGYARVFEWGEAEREFKYSAEGKCNFTVTLDTWYVAYSLKTAYQSTIFDHTHFWKENNISASFNLPTIDPIISSLSISGTNSVSCKIYPKSFSMHYPTDHSRYGKPTSYLSVTTTLDDNRIIKCSSYTYNTITHSYTANHNSVSGVTYSWSCNNATYATVNNKTSKTCKVVFSCPSGSNLYKGTVSSVTITLKCTAKVGSYSKSSSYKITLTKSNYIYWSTDNNSIVSISGSPYTNNLQCNITAHKNINNKTNLRTYTDSSKAVQTNSTSLDVRLMIESITCYTTTANSDWNVIPDEDKPSYSSELNPIKLLFKPYPVNCNSSYWNQAMNNIQSFTFHKIEDGQFINIGTDNDYFTVYDYGVGSHNYENNKYYACSIDPNEDFIKYNTDFQSIITTNYSIYVDSSNKNYLTDAHIFEIVAKDWSIKNITAQDINTSLGISSCYFIENDTSSNTKSDEIDSGEVYNTTVYITRESQVELSFNDIISVEPIGTTEILTKDNFTSSEPDIATVIDVQNNSNIILQIKNVGTTTITVTTTINKISTSFNVVVGQDNELIINKVEPSAIYPLVDSYNLNYNAITDTFNLLVNTNFEHNGTLPLLFNNKREQIGVLNLRCNLRPNGINIVANPNNIPQDNISNITATVLPQTDSPFTTVADKYNKISKWNLTYSTSNNLGELRNGSSDFHKIYYAYLNNDVPTYEAYVTATVKSETNSFEPINGTTVIGVNSRGIKIIPNELEILQGSFATASVITIPNTDNYTYSIDNDNVSVNAQDKTLIITGNKIGKTVLTAVSSYTQSHYEDTLNIKVIKQFNAPEIYYPNKITGQLVYYTNHPKIVFKLPSLAEKLSVDDILVNITAFDKSNKMVYDNTYSAFENSNLFSMAYEHTFENAEQLILNAINSDSCYCVFSDINNNYYDDESVSYIVATILFKSNSSLCKDKFTTVTLFKALMPTLPKVNDYMLASDLISSYKALVNIVSQVYNSDYANMISSISSLGNKGDLISVYPFYIALNTFNTILKDIADKAHSCYNHDSVIPEYLSPTAVRLLYVTNKLSEQYKDLPMILEAKTDYPIMVDDSADYVYNDENCINEFKNTNFYNEFTVSPLSEINKAISKF